MANEHEWDEEDYLDNPTIEDMMGEMLSNLQYQWDVEYEITHSDSKKISAEIEFKNEKYKVTLSQA